MAIILRGDKGSALSHHELDNNFRHFIYSSSISGTAISLFTTASLNNEIQIPGGAPSGSDYNIQYKVGNAVSGANALYGATPNLKFDYRQNSLKLTGSLVNVGDAFVDGDLTVTGTVTAQEYRTEFVNASVVFESGSTKFGDTSDDNHDFVGDMSVDGDLTVTGTMTAQEVRTEFNNASVVFESGSTKFGDTLDDKHTFTGSLGVTGSHDVSGTITATESIISEHGTFMNPDTVTKYFKVPSNYNAGLFGPITNSSLIEVDDNATLIII